MGIFNKSDQLSPHSSNTTIIATGTKIRGELHVECRVHVDGEFSGPINSQSTITVGKNGVIEGDVAAEKLIVTGGFSGTADCGEIQILAGGRVVGQIVCKTFVIERGGFFNGQSKLKESSLGVTHRPRSESPLVAMDNAPDKVTRISEASQRANMG